MKSGSQGNWCQVRSMVGIGLVSLLFIGWCGWFIERTSFFVDGQRHFVLFDDAMVSMTYARNLVEGQCLNWAREGEPVEGYTTPLWTALMVPINASGIDLKYRSLLVQLLSLVLLVAHLFLIRRIATRFFSNEVPNAWWPAVVLTAAYYPLNYWSLMGMETALQTLLVAAAVYWAYQITEARRDRILPLWCLFSVAYLVRMDMVILVVVVLFYVATLGGIRRAELRRWVAGATLFLAVAGGYQLFRWFYFGDLLPNTYYLKLTGTAIQVRWLRGFYVYLSFLKTYGWALGVAFCGLICYPKLRRRASLPLLLFTAYSAYSVYVGGDAWEYPDYVTANRFLVFALPPLFLVCGATLASFLALIQRRSGWGGWQALGLVRAALLGVTLTLVLLVNGLLLSSGAKQHWKLFSMRDRPMLVGSHAVVIDQLRELQKLVPSDARVATFWAGIPAFFSDFRLVDMFGYSDRYIARLSAVKPLDTDSALEFRPGHMKWNYPYIFVEKRPDAFLQAWNLGQRQARVMDAHGFERHGEIWVRKELLELSGR